MFCRPIVIIILTFELKITFFGLQIYSFHSSAHKLWSRIFITVFRCVKEVIYS